MAELPRTRRRPVRANTDLVRSVLGRLAERDVDWAPRFLAVDSGDEVLSWLPGQTVEEWWDQPDRLDVLTRDVRELHDATVDLASGGECCVHDDLQPRNVVVKGTQLGLIDWEQLRPGRRVEDVAQLCWSFATGPDLSDVVVIGQRWKRVLDVYGLSRREDVLPAALAKIGGCIDDIVRGQTEGSSRHQKFAARGDHVELDKLRAWLEANQAALAQALG